ncbi:AmmeMemoRadiSam system protein B [Clostridia bacterium]|nr:AmmeMemoRadiSam system protein B [Clostridia bacterium]
MGKIIRGYLVPHPPIIIPEVGGITRKRVQKTIKAMERMAKEVAELRPDTIIVTTPHAQSFRDFFYLPDGDILGGDFSAFGAKEPSFIFRHNMVLMGALCKACEKEGFFAGFLNKEEKKRFSIEERLDHGALVPLYFVQQRIENISILYLPTPYQDIKQMVRFGEILGQTVRESSERVVFLASGDLSHCLNESAPAGYNEAGKRYDKKLYDIVERLDEETFMNITIEEMQDAAECGTRSFATLWGSMHECKLESEIYSYEGTLGVGYLVAAIQQSKEKKHE